MKDSGKDIIISVAAADGKQEYQDVTVMPGTRPRDILSQLNLNGFQLNKSEEGFFAMTDDLYSAVEHGQKLFATKSDVEAGVTLA